MSRRHQYKAAPAGAFGNKTPGQSIRIRQYVPYVSPEILEEPTEVVIAEPAGLEKSIAELTHDLRDIHEAVAWFPASAYMTTLLKEIIRELAALGGSEFLDDLGIVSLDDLSSINDMSGVGVAELLDQALISVPAEALMARVGRPLLARRAEALVRTRQRLGLSDAIDYEEPYQSGCTGKKPYQDQSAAEEFLRTARNPHTVAYECPKCRQWHVSQHFVTRHR